MSASGAPPGEWVESSPGSTFHLLLPAGNRVLLELPEMSTQTGLDPIRSAVFAGFIRVTDRLPLTHSATGSSIAIVRIRRVCR